MQVQLCLVLLMALGACAVLPQIDVSAPRPEELRRVAYAGAGDAAGALTLVDDFHVFGDLDGDGRDEAVVLLSRSPGGTGVWSYLAVVTRAGGRLFNIATVGLGDRVQLRSARIEGGTLFASGVRAGPADPACCAGDLVEWSWVLRDARLDAIDTVVTGRLSLAALAGSPWVLRAWDIGEPAPERPVVTLAYDAGRLTGSAGCNRYSAGLTEGPLPGEITAGPVAATRMACPDAESAVEARLLQRLGAARRFGFRAGRLALTSSAADGSTRTMLFEAQGPAQSR